MKNFYILTDALAYIEKNICEDIDSQSVADSCGVSLSSLQKLFRLALNKSVKDSTEYPCRSDKSAGRGSTLQ